MKIITKSDSIHVDKSEGTSVDYYIRQEYEVHYNELKPGVVQHWHHHQTINETLFILEGSLEAWWLDEDNNKQKCMVNKGDLVEVENTPHTFVNSSGKVVKFIVFRFVLTGEDKREVIKNDKFLDTNLE
jgi:uncharacterized cupin superfamily protein